MIKGKTQDVKFSTVYLIASALGMKVSEFTDSPLFDNIDIEFKSKFLVNNLFVKQTLKYIYNLLHDQMKYAEAKYSISITLATALTVFSATYLKNFAPLITALSAISIIFSLISVAYGFLAISSKRFSTKKYKPLDRKLNLMYYKDIASLNEKNYLEELIKNYPFLKGYKPDEFDCDLAKQVINTSKGISQKFIFFNFSVVFLVVSLITESVAIFLLGMGVNV